LVNPPKIRAILVKGRYGQIRSHDIYGTIPSRRRVELVPPPIWVKPQLAKLVEKAPDGSDWLHEIKFDGYRMHARLDAGRAQILTRWGNDWTEKYPIIAKSIAGLPARNAYLDSELPSSRPRTMLLLSV
jgi:ATP-dependent DNA ligase